MEQERWLVTLISSPMAANINQVVQIDPWRVCWAICFKGHLVGRNTNSLSLSPKIGNVNYLLIWSVVMERVFKVKSRNKLQDLCPRHYLAVTAEPMIILSSLSTLPANSLHISVRQIPTLTMGNAWVVPPGAVAWWGMTQTPQVPAAPSTWALPITPRIVVRMWRVFIMKSAK